MNVMMVINSSYGLYSFRRELVEALLEKKHRVTIVAGNSDKVEYFRNLGCTVELSDFDNHGTNPLKEMQLLKYYKAQIRKYKPDCVLTYTIKPNIYAGMACASMKVPYIENITGLGTAVENAGVMQTVTVALYRRALRKCRKVFFQNCSNRDFMLRKGIVKEKNIDLLPGSGVNLKQFEVLDYPEGECVEFAFLSRIMKEKGIDEYLEAAKIIRSRHPGTVFHVCGTCDENYKAVIREAHDQGLIVYHGMVNDVREIHRISSCTVMPSSYPEGMSNVLLESCACGRPIITTDRPGCGEAVDDGVNGFVVKQKDSGDLVEKIEAFLKMSVEERRQMGLAGRAKVEREFDRQIVIDKYMQELERV